MIGQIFDISSYSLNSYALPTFVLSLSIPLLLLTVVIREQASPLSVAFTALGFFNFLWFFSFSLMYCSIDPRTALWWAKAAYLGIPFIPAVVYHFTVSVLRSYRGNRNFVLIGWMISALFSAFALWTDKLITGVSRYWWGFYPLYGWPGSLFVSFFAIMMLASLGHYLHKYREQTSALQRLRTRSFLWAFSIAFAGFVDFLPKYGISFYPFGYLPVFVFMLLSARSIWHYHLEDITPAFTAERIIETIGDALIVIDYEGIVRVANRAAADLFRMPKRGITGKPFSAIMDDKIIHQNLEILKKQRRVLNLEFCYKDNKGGKKVLNYSMAAMMDQSGHPLAIICVFADITERKRSEEELERHRLHLEELVKERTDNLKQINEQLEHEIAGRSRIEEALKESERRYRLLIENQNDLIIELGSDFLITFISPNCRQLFGKSEDHFIGNNFFHIFNGGQQDRLVKTLKLFLEKSPNRTYHETEIVTLEGPRWFGWSSRALIDKHGKIHEIITVGRDVSDRRQDQDRLKQSHKTLINLLDGIDAIVYVADMKSYEVLYVNKYTRNIFGDVRGKICWQTFQSHQSGPCDFCTNPKLLDPGGEPGEAFHWEFQNTVNGKWYDIRDRAIEWIDGRTVKLEIATDITGLKEAEEVLRSMSIIDDLTGLYNRRGFMTLAHQQLKAAERERRKLLLIYADLDNMKWVNDTMGHIEGDNALVSTARILKETFRESDIIARIGGDEFVILAAETPEIRLSSITDRLQAQMNAYNIKEHRPFSLSLSIGTAHFDPERPCSVETLLSDADTLMYRVKKAKKHK